MAAGSIGKYERLDVLGHGTSGVVYLAWDTLLRRQVALKEIRADGPEMERLLDEARVLDRLRHPNIVRIHSVDVAPDNVVLLDMELIRGRNLASLIKERAGVPFPPDEAARIALPVLDALGYAHERRIIHRDVKPANILLGDDGTVKLTDFGLAEALGTGSVAGGGGTYPYMAPEDFAEDAASDRRSDLWAVGVLLYEMLTGRRPFTVARIKDPFAWKRTVEQDEPPVPTDVNASLAPAWNVILSRALAKNKEERWGAAREFMDAVSRVSGVSTESAPAAQEESASEPPRTRRYEPPPVVGVPRPPASVPRPPMPIFAPPAPGMRGGAFVFAATGEIVYTLDELLAMAARNWDESRRALLEGRVEGFLRGIGEVYVADLAGEMFQRSHAGESPDRLLKEFLERARGEELAPQRTTPKFAEAEMGTVAARPVPPGGDNVSRERDAGVDAVGSPPASSPDDQGGPKPGKSPGTRWWYWPVLALSSASPGVAVLALAQPGARHAGDPTGLLLLAGATSGVFCVMLVLIAMGTRMAWSARLLPLVPMGIGGLCMGGLIARSNASGANLTARDLVLIASPVAFLVLQAATARVLWRLWLGFLIAVAAATVLVFASGQLNF